MKRRDPLAAVSGTIMVVGIAILLVSDALDVWPWILAVIGLSTLPTGLARGGLVAGWLPAATLVGIAALVAADRFWPFILILLAAVTLAGMFIRRTR